MLVATTGVQLQDLGGLQHDPQAAHYPKHNSVLKCHLEFSFHGPEHFKFFFPY